MSNSTSAPVPADCEAAQMGCPDGFEVFVGKMPMNTTDDALRQLSASYNPHAVRVLTKADRNGQMCGFVIFTELKCAQQFIRDNDNKQSLGGHDRLNVRFADGKTRKKIFVGGLLPGSNEQTLEELGSVYGAVLSTKVLSKNEKAPCGFIVFANPNQAEACIASLDGTPNPEGTKNYVVKFAKAPEQGSGKGGGKGGKGSKGMKRNRDDNDFAYQKRHRADSFGFMAQADPYCQQSAYHQGAMKVHPQIMSPHGLYAHTPSTTASSHYAASPYQYMGATPSAASPGQYMTPTAVSTPGHHVHTAVSHVQPAPGQHYQVVSMPQHHNYQVVQHAPQQGYAYPNPATAPAQVGYGQQVGYGEQQVGYGEQDQSRLSVSAPAPLY